MRIFISYASARQETAEHICAFLEAGGKKCWIAPRDIPAGSNYGEEIIKGIEDSDAFVLVFDKAANESQHVLREVERAVSKKLPIVVYRLDDTVPSKAMEYFLLSIQWLDAGEVTEQSLGKLEAALERQNDVIKQEINPHVKISLKKRLGILFAVILILAIMIVLGTVQRNRDEHSRPEPTGVTEQPEAENVDFTVGDYVSFGRYVPGGKTAKDGEGEITWQVVDTGEEGTLLVATDILAIRPFDCAESGVFDRDEAGVVYDRNKRDTYSDAQMREFRGSNDWETSDLCAWLNASGVVVYPGKAPQDTATDEHGNAYGTEAGFLTDFTKSEATLVEQSGNGVFLLTKEQVWEYALTGSLNPSAVPTEAAIAADQTNWYRNYKDSGATDYIWATATAAEERVCNIYYVNVSGADETFGTLPAAAAGHGIRPAICIFTENGYWEGDGSRQNPYRLAE